MGESEQQSQQRCERHAVEIKRMQQDLLELKADIVKIREEQNELKSLNIVLSESQKNLQLQFNKIEFSLQEISKELKGISDSIIYLKMRNSKEKTDDQTNGFISKLIDGNNKTLLILVLALASALLFSLGVNIGDIIKILPIGG